MFKFNLLTINGITGKRAEKLTHAMRHAEEIINGHAFEKWFLAQKFTQLGDMKGKENDELLALLRREVKVNYSVVKRSWWKRWSSVIGWRLNNPKTKGDDVFTYADSYDAMSMFGLVDHLTHEIACHCNGFSHEPEWSRERDFSIPYLVGKTVEAMALVKKS